MPFVAATSSHLPSHCYTQESLASILGKYCVAMGYDVDLDMIDSMFTNTTIKQRYFAVPLDNFYEPPPRKTFNDLAFDAAVDICGQLIRSMLDRTQLQPTDIGRITSMMTTLFAVPTLEARLISQLKFSNFIKRVPLNGLGCLGGAAGFARVADYLKGYPREAALLVCCELGGSAFWLGGIQGFLKYASEHMAEEASLAKDLIAQVVSAALFGDGASGVLMVGREHPLAGTHLPEVVDSRSITLYDSEQIMFVRVLDHGFMNTLSTEIPDYAGRALRMAIEPMLAEHHLTVSDIEHWMFHPGGPKVLDGVQQALKLSDSALALSRDTLAKVGNLSAPTVLTMLDQLVTSQKPAKGSYGILASMGPGFSEEIVLLRW